MARKRHGEPSGARGRGSQVFGLIGVGLSLMVIVGVVAASWAKVATGAGLEPQWSLRGGTWTFPIVGAIGFSPVVLVLVVVTVFVVIRALRLKGRTRP
jgi:hypothetical protein